MLFNWTDFWIVLGVLGTIIIIIVILDLCVVGAHSSVSYWSGCSIFSIICDMISTFSLSEIDKNPCLWAIRGSVFHDGISSWNLVLHDQPSSMCSNEVSYHSLIWHSRPINLEMLCQAQIFAECNNSKGIGCIPLFLLMFLYHFVMLCFHILI